MLLELAPAALVERMNRLAGESYNSSGSPLQTGALFGQAHPVDVAPYEKQHHPVEQDVNHTSNGTQIGQKQCDSQNTVVGVDSINREVLKLILQPCKRISLLGNEDENSGSPKAPEPKKTPATPIPTLSADSNEESTSEVLLRLRKRQRQYSPTEDEIAIYRRRYEAVTVYTVRLNWVLCELLALDEILTKIRDETSETWSSMSLLEAELSLLLAYVPETDIKRAQVFPNGYLSQVVLDNYDLLINFGTQYPNLHLASKAIRFLVKLLYNVNYWETYHLVYTIPKISYFLELLKFEIIDTPFGPLVRPPKDYVNDKMLSGLQYPFPYPFYNFSYHSFNPVGHLTKYKGIHIDPYIDIRLQSTDSTAQDADQIDERQPELMLTRNKRRKTSVNIAKSKSHRHSKSINNSKRASYQTPTSAYTPTESKYYLYYGLPLDEHESTLSSKEKELLTLIPEYLRPLRVFGRNPLAITKVQAEAQARQLQREQERLRNIPPGMSGDVVTLNVIPVGPDVEKSNTAPQEILQESTATPSAESKDEEHAHLVPRMVGNQVVLVDDKPKPQPTKTPTRKRKASDRLDPTIDDERLSIDTFINEEHQNSSEVLPLRTTTIDSTISPGESGPTPSPYSTTIGLPPVVSASVSTILPLTTTGSQIGPILTGITEEQPSIMSATIGVSKPAFELSKRPSRIELPSFTGTGEVLTDISSEASSLGGTNPQGATTHQCFLTDPSTQQTCLKRFYGKNELMRHQEFVHATQKKIYRCIYCLKNNSVVQCYPRHDSLARHIRKKHGVTGRENKIAVNYAKANVEIINEPLNSVLSKGKKQMIMHDDSEDELDSERTNKASLKLPLKDKTSIGTSSLQPMHQVDGILAATLPVQVQLSQSSPDKIQLEDKGATDNDKETGRLTQAPLNMYPTTSSSLPLTSPVGHTSADLPNRIAQTAQYSSVVQTENQIIPGGQIAATTPLLHNTNPTQLAPISAAQQSVTGSGSTSTAPGALGGIPPIRAVPSIPGTQTIGYPYPQQQLYLHHTLAGEQTPYMQQHPILVSPNSTYSQRYPYFLSQPLNTLQPAAYSPQMTNKYGYPFLSVVGGSATPGAGASSPNQVAGATIVPGSTSAPNVTAGGSSGSPGGSASGIGINGIPSAYGSATGASPYNLAHHLIQTPIAPHPATPQGYLVQYYTGTTNAGGQFLFYHPMAAPGIAPGGGTMPLIHRLPQIGQMSPPTQSLLLLNQPGLPYGAVTQGVFGAPQLPRPPQSSDKRQ